MLRRSKFFFPALVILLIVILLAAIAFGAVSIRIEEMFSAIGHWFQGKGPANIYEGVFLQIRLLLFSLFPSGIQNSLTPCY